MLWVWSLAFWQRFQKRGCCRSYGQNWTILHILSILCWTTTGACSAKTPSTAICWRKTFFSFQPKFSFGLIVCHCDVTISTSMGRAREVSMIMIGVHTFSFTIKAALLVLSYHKHHSMINDCGYICLLSLDAHLYVSLGRHQTKVPLSSLHPFHSRSSTVHNCFSLALQDFRQCFDRNWVLSLFLLFCFPFLLISYFQGIMFNFFCPYALLSFHTFSFYNLSFFVFPVNQYLLSHLWWISLLNKM